MDDSTLLGLLAPVWDSSLLSLALLHHGTALLLAMGGFAVITHRGNDGTGSHKQGVAKSTHAETHQSTTFTLLPLKS